MKNKSIIIFLFIFLALMSSVNLMAHPGHKKAPDYTNLLLSEGANNISLETARSFEEKTSYSSLSSSWLNGYVYPENETEIAVFFAVYQRRKEAGQRLFRLTTTGSSMSFGLQSLPPLPKMNVHHLIFSLEKMNYVEVTGVYPDKNNPERVRVRAGGGATWEQVIKKAREETGLLLIPFDTPSSDKITLAGCLASNTFSRTSDVQGSYSSSYFHRFELLTPTAHLRCSAHSHRPVERDCYRIIPGAMGLAGVITSMEVDLRVVEPDHVVHTMVFEHTRGIEPFVERFEMYARDNRERKEWDQGFYAIVHEDSDEPYGILMGSKLGRKTWKDEEIYNRPLVGDTLDYPQAPCQHYEDGRFDCSVNMPLYSENLKSKGMLIQVGRMFTPYEINRWIKWISPSIHHYAEPWLQNSFPDYIKRRELYAGRRFTDATYAYTFYHNGYWEAHGGDSKEQLPNMHQAWVMDVSDLARFMEKKRDLLNSSKQYRDQVRNNIILQDVTPVPADHRPMSPIPASVQPAEQRMAVIYQITVALGDGSDQQLVSSAEQFYQALSREVQSFAHVHLLKETHIETDILKKQYEKGIAELNGFRKAFDPDYIFRSMFWETLLPEK